VRTGKIFNVATGEETTIEEPDVVASAEQKLDFLRTERNRRLHVTDVWALSDRTMTQAQIDYRQALRDITKTATSLDDVSWPEKP
tara:strand:+ start:731 stop:985 length:255 start_codon:yes stop_codon:yes gene_type:complete